MLVQHRSHYVYPEPVFLGQHTIRLRPASHAKARIEAYSLSVPQAQWTHWITDVFGNRVARCTFDAEQAVSELDVLVELAVEVQPVNPFDFFVEEYARTAPFSYDPDLEFELAPFRQREPAIERAGPRMTEFLRSLPRDGDVVELVVELNRLVRERVDYVIREEAGVWTPEETLAQGRGSCRDSAMLLVAALRSRGLAARFVSGYLVQVTDEGLLPDLPRGMDRDVVDLHAWAEVYLPGAGWVGLDATSGLLCGEGHIPLACASAPPLAAPLVGTASGTAHRVEFSMAIARLGHEPSPSRPYTEEVWAELLDASRAVDARLSARGVALTVGGEPTFNAREHADAPEWNGAALGPHKWERGLVLAEQLRLRLAPGGVLFRRMGKHYPGESLPRWALDVYGRKDGTPLWTAPRSDKVAEASDAMQVAAAIAERLGLTGHLHTGFEDPWHFLHQEAGIPIEEDPMRADLTSSEERRRLARVLNRGLREPVGFALPLRHEGRGWQSDTWTFRRGWMFLIPGDSPMGLRLPLGSIGGPTHEPPDSEPVLERPDPRRAGQEAARRQRRREVEKRRVPGHDVGGAAAATSEADSAHAAKGVRTALCVELRKEGPRPELFVFLPPVSKAEQFIELVSHVDAVAQRFGLDVVLEGYPPPPNTTLFEIAVTPDPGVLEVNIPPTSTTDEYVGLMETVYGAALHAGLHSEKYLVDGRQAGSGGGHHLTLGGAHALSSPFLLRADLLASVLTFVQHHPSLSYMFGGLFVGPTSQSPRIDEARHESLYELEIALARAFERGDAGVMPWEIDMLFRHLLVDLTGNTHRAEVSIDKLFDWQTPHGRKGLIELRAFEMPPHPRMAVAQMLLVRALVASFVDRPYRAPLVRWGQTLHDRFLLPYWMWRDFEDVLGHLDARGLALGRAAFEPFVDLRCPVVGTLQCGDIELEVRNAIEPWNVLGEELTASGTARYVDSSLERVQIRAEGLIAGRHAILVNGVSLPLRSTPRAHEAVAGVRFRAWAPPHSLHPHLGVHHPLRIDVFDTWNERALGGCTYHVWHPEGRAFDAPPLTRFEAAARRHQRFTTGDHSQWPVAARPSAVSDDQPYCLDLRRHPVDRHLPEDRLDADGRD